MLENILILTHPMACYQNNNKIFFFRLSAKRRRSNDIASVRTSYCLFFIVESIIIITLSAHTNIWFIYCLFVYVGALSTCVELAIIERTSCINRMLTKSDSLTQCRQATHCLSVYWLRSKLNDCFVCDLLLCELNLRLWAFVALQRDCLGMTYLSLKGAEEMAQIWVFCSKG